MKNLVLLTGVLGALVSAQLVAAPVFAVTAPRPAPKPKSAAPKKPSTPKKKQVVGKAKFVLKGTVVSVKDATVTIHVVSATQNAKVFVNTDKALTVEKRTKITKTGKAIAFKNLTTSATVKVYGIFDQKTGAITFTRWIKVINK